MKALFIEPGKKPVVKEIVGDLASMQHEVGGYIEITYPFEDEVCIVCNEEGKLNGSELNRALRDDDGTVYDIIAGTFLIMGLGEEDMVDLTDEMIEIYKNMFETPEMFVNMGGTVCILPVI